MKSNTPTQKLDPLAAFIASEQSRMEKDRQEYLEEQDFKDFVRWPQGVTEFTLEPVIPRVHESFGAEKRLFRVTVDGDLLDWSVNPRSPMYRELLDVLGGAPVELSINRLGEGLETRYNLAVLAE